jgi:hypothetical protein
VLRKAASKRPTHTLRYSMLDTGYLVKWKETYNTLLGQELDKGSEMALVSLLIDAPSMGSKCAQKSLGALSPKL